MMHGYIAQDAAGELLVPFRTWRNTNTADAAAELSDLFDVNIPFGGRSRTCARRCSTASRTSSGSRT